MTIATGRTMVGRATLEVRMVGGKPSFRGMDEDRVQVLDGGNLHLERLAMSGEEVRLHFLLVESPRYALRGIRMGMTDGDWERRQVTLDTGGERYVDELDQQLPFEVTPLVATGRGAGFTLLQVGDPTAARTVHEWWYELAFEGPQGTFYVDPKIYGEGDGGGG